MLVFSVAVSSLKDSQLNSGHSMSAHLKVEPAQLRTFYLRKENHST
jgi:hypothetical protein